jgi:Rps23 Pro-64 3,4-dihydroxylase Tpa1-like proline 4-hydroxylase
MINNIIVIPNIYQETKPYPYAYQDDILDDEFAKQLRSEILNIPEESWDRYENPFESKFTLRDKYNFPANLKKLFAEFESDSFISKLSEIVGYKLIIDSTRNFWGIHKYNNGDKLDIHVDAGLHPTTKQKKQVTLGIYLSENWKEEYGCELEVWKGENAVSNDAKIYEKVASISPLFNRMIIFTCNDYAWHGNPEPARCPEDSKRIFVTISYLSENYEDQNKRQKAYFVSRPQDPEDKEKDKLRLLRADPEKYKDVLVWKG